jgi:hypothetical protein
MAARPGILVAALLTLASCTHNHVQTANTVTVEEYVSDVPVGATVRVCLQHVPCRTNIVTAHDHSGAPQVMTVALPPRVSLRQADGWTVRASATAHGVTYRSSARVTYLVAVDPPCKCTGDYVHLYFRSVRK